MRKKAVQQGRSEQRGESYSVLYVEPLSDAITPLAVFVRILLERLVCAVTEWWGFCMLALAQRNVFLFGHGKLNRLEPGSLMRSVTKWLVPRTATRTPIVGSRLKRHHGWFLGCNAWVSHESYSLCVVKIGRRDRSI